MSSGVKKLGIASFTVRGKSVADKLAAAFEEDYEIARYETGLRAWCGSLFASGADGIIFVGACGIAVRSVAPFLKSKTTDPAVLVIDEAGHFVISLLSGHIGGANRLALRAAEVLGATPVITTATDVNGKFAVDVFAKDNGLRIGSMKAAKEVSAAILRGEKVGIYCEGEIEGNIPPELVLYAQEDAEFGNLCNACRTADRSERREELHPGDVHSENVSGIISEDKGESVITEKTGNSAIHIGLPSRSLRHSIMFETQNVLTLCPKAYVLGIGCRRGKTDQEIELLADQSLAKLGLTYEDIVGVASIDLKNEEPGLVDFCKKHGMPFETYPARTLAAIKGAVSSSAFVSEVTGVDNVCERAALCMAKEDGRLVLPKQAENGVTVAIAEQHWQVRF
ncbi:MAG: cobalamin biosynthesis protein [Lachnospiraceae bacterium]|nr:cobalamin biosynthesis protein [Lachnospiraceae bacterium]